ncbi:peroxidase N [Aegilops tauschii subsp. strangulata]|uniref:Peroxidase n=1 Tax=Aegilops tauschii subsp. strangulata TaxID=200361 RepID=A0A452XZT9_AEGTS|nr:peroxidase N [Aegilops tauschii subsp. strangulata]
MEYSHRSRLLLVCSVLVLCLVTRGARCDELTSDFYDWTCPGVYDVVQQQVFSAMREEPRMGASLLRLHFHDCFVNGCDGSILLDGTDGEKFALPNQNSVRGYEVIDAIKADLENMCPGVVSCADIVAIAAGYGVLFSGGPYYDVLLGRRDGLKANQTGADNGLPSPFEPISSIVQKFADVGLDTKDVVVLSGAHTIGRARCVLFSDRLTSTKSSADPTLDATMAADLQKLCTGGDGNQTTALDVSSGDVFDKQYYHNLLSKKGLLTSDQGLFSADEDVVASTTKALVQTYSDDGEQFFSDFGASMVKMGSIPLPAGSAGEIRCNCRVPNKK